MKKPLLLISTIVICLAIGFISGLFTSDAVQGWYQDIAKPVFNPPNWLFAPVWTALYVLMGISLYLLWTSNKSKTRNLAIKYFAIQLALNFFWSILFFGARLPGLALVEIIVLWIFILLTAIVSWKINKWASYLLWPYLVWVTFATVLNAAIVILN